MIESIYEDFGIDAEALRVWSQSFVPDLKCSLDNTQFLITDGDCGVALISYSDIHHEDGITIELIGCKYCEFNFEMLMYAYGGILQNVANCDESLQEEE